MTSLPKYGILLTPKYGQKCKFKRVTQNLRVFAHIARQYGFMRFQFSRWNTSEMKRLSGHRAQSLLLYTVTENGALHAKLWQPPLWGWVGGIVKVTDHLSFKLIAVSIRHDFLRSTHAQFSVKSRTNDVGLSYTTRFYREVMTCVWRAKCSNIQFV